MPDVQDEDGHRTKRFKHQSYNEQLRNVHAPSTLTRSRVDEALEEEDGSLFYGALSHWMQLNLSPSFIRFAQKVLPLSKSLPLLIHSWREVADLWLDCVGKSDDEALKALFDLLQKLVQDLRTTLLPYYTTILQCLLSFLRRRIPPESLTALLASLTTVFKTLLASSLSENLANSSEDGLLGATWTDLYASFGKCNPEVQRAVAEVWGLLIRRLNKSDRHRCINMMLETANEAKPGETLDDFIAWSLCFACKSVAQTIHTCGPSLLLSCLDYHIKAEVGHTHVTEKLLRRLLTALIHHCSKADQFAAMSEPLLRKFSVVAEEDKNTAVVKNILDIIAVPCSVRQGSRLTPKQLSQILNTTLQLTFSDTICKSLLSVTVAALTASTSDLTVWMGAGRRVVEHAWASSNSYAMLLSGALLETGFGGFKQFALPLFMGKCSALLASEDVGVQVNTLRMLSSLVRENVLKHIDDPWRESLTSWVRSWLGKFVITENTIISLAEIAEILPILDTRALLPGFISIAQELVADDLDTAHNGQESWANRVWVVGRIMRLLSSRKEILSIPDLDVDHLIMLSVGKWYWSEYLMAGAANIGGVSSKSRPQGLSMSDETLERLRGNLKSHSHIIRRSSLELLSYAAAFRQDGEEVLKRCLAAELIPLSVQGARERVLRIGRVGQAIQGDNARSAEICLNWLLGQLKVGLRPIWSPATEAIASLSRRFPDLVWRNLIVDLKLGGDVISTDTPGWTRDVVEIEDDVKEVERSWRDPSAHKLRVVVASAMDNVSCKTRIIKEQTPDEFHDPGTYEAQLLATLGEMVSLAEKHNQELVPVFLSFASPSVLVKPRRAKLANWLSLFSKLSNPKALFSSMDVYEIYISLLSHPDRSLQLASLSCLLTYKSPALLPHEEKLKLLLDDTKWRDELAGLDLQNIEQNERRELVPVLIRLFFGMMLERKGHGKGADRRPAMLSALGFCTEDELTLLVDLMVEPFKGKANLDEPKDDEWRVGTTQIDLTEKQKIGFLVFLGDVLKHLGTLIPRSWPRLVALTVTLTAQAQQKLQVDLIDVSGEADDVHEVDEEILSSITLQRQLRIIRQNGLKRLTQFFHFPIEFDFKPYIPELFRTVISPRLPLLDRENTQAPSALFELLDVWSTRPETARFIVAYDSRTLAKVCDCMVATNVKPAVLLRIFDMIERLLKLSSSDEELSTVIVKPYMTGLLDNVTTVVQSWSSSGTLTDIVAQREISLLSQISPYLDDSDQASKLLSLFLPLLRRAGKGVPEKLKVDILLITSNLLRRIPDIADESAHMSQKTYDTFSYLFELLRGRQGRIALVDSFSCLASIDMSLRTLSNILSSLNAFSSTRLEEPDFDRRLNAFASLNDEFCRGLSVKEWKPLLHNMIFSIQDEGELAIRSNASQILRRFLDALSDSDMDDMRSCFARILFPSLKRCLRSKSDLVRSEVLGVVAYGVRKCENVEGLQDMRVLLADGDEEANFFNNVFHVQVHRRIRALHRLADYCDKPGFRSATLQEIFLPVVNSFIASSGVIDHHLVNEAVLTLGHIAKHLSWSAYFAVVQKYIKSATVNATSERVSTRALVSILDNFYFMLEESFIDDTTNITDEGQDQEDSAVENCAPQPATKILDAVSSRLLPSLLKHLEQRDEMEDVNRIPIAVGIAKVAIHLPETSRSLQIQRLLTVLSQVFRSKSQETRDLTRETLCRIAAMLGPNYLPQIIQHLRGALLRGPHLHVLAYVTHALLVHVTTINNEMKVDTLDNCVADAVHVSSEVVFGQSGKDVTNEGFKTKMKEVRSSSSKGLDSFSILAKFVSPRAFRSLLTPVKAIMQETESSKTMQVVDDVLRRMTIGINANAHFSPTELLGFCHTLISQDAHFFEQAVKPLKRKAKKANDVTIQLQRKVDVDADHYAHNSWRFICFGLELFGTAYKRGRFDWEDPSTMSRLESMVNIIAKTLYASNGNIVSAGLKATSQIVKCPLKNIEKNLPIFVRQCLEIIRESGSTEADVTQTAFRTLAVIIRDCSTSQVKEKDLTFLLELLTSDLEEPSRQATAFSLLRAIVHRKFIVPEIYDLMEKVSEIMVTNQSTQVQELCRSVLLQFLLDYPQGKGRLKQQFAFLVKNLSYIFESGRKSVLELLSAVISKFNDSLIEEYADMLFVGFVMVVANDDSASCREMAAQLIRTLVGRLREDQQRSIVSHVHSWASQHDNHALARVSSQTYGMILDALKKDAAPYLPGLLDDVNVKARNAAKSFIESEAMDEEMECDGWQTPYQALTTISKVLQIFPEVTSDIEKVPWSSISALLLYPHAWVRTVACRLIGSLFSVTPVGLPSADHPADFPLSPTGMKAVASSLSVQLKSDHLDEALCLQIVKNLFYIGKCFYLAPLLPESQIIKTDKHAGELIGREESESKDDSSEDEANEDTEDNDNSLPWLFSRLSFQARSAHIARRNRKGNMENWSRQPSAVFRWFAAMASHMEADHLKRFLPHILAPLYRIVDDDSIRDPQMDELKTLAVELQDLVQNKAGTTEFADVYNRIRQNILAVRRERRTTRVIQIATNPQATARRRMHKNMNKKEARKRKSSEFAESKIRMKFSKKRKVA